MGRKFESLRLPAVRLPLAVLLPFAMAAFASMASVPASALPESAQKKKADDRKKEQKPILESGFPEQTGRGGYKIGVSVDLVVVHTSVHDENGHFVSGLTKEKFVVYEDGVAQSIASFSQEDVPITLGLVVDISGSMRSKINLVTKAAQAFINSRIPEDETFLVGFNDEVELLEDFSTDVDLIADSLDNIIVSGGTALFDAIYLGVQKANEGSKPKKAIILISDGEDRDSYYKLKEVLSKVQESDTQIYSIGFLDPTPDKGLFGRFTKSDEEKAREALQQISEETGGKPFFPEEIDEITQIVQEIGNELRNQYGIGFLSSNPERDGSWRRLKISLADKEESYRIRFRRGYYAPKPAETK